MTPKAATSQTTINGVHLGLIVTLVALSGSTLVGAGYIFDRELSPIREDISEIKLDIRELRVRPVPQGLLDEVASIARRMDALERND